VPDYYALQRRVARSSRWQRTGQVVEVATHALRYRDGVFGPDLDAVVYIVTDAVAKFGTIDLAVLDAEWSRMELD
jgi:hypothetical protein